jgi:hypothetical protein
MSKAATSHRWFQGRRANPQPVDTDPADLGTAFGLDLSLNEIEHERPAAVAPAWRQSGWMGRLTFRRKPAA